MYPVFRLGWHIFRYRNAPVLPVGGVHECSVICRPWDIDLWRELNNGRTLTLYDLGRVVLIRRSRLVSAMGKQGWGAVVAGVSVRYRRRIRMFECITMRSRVAGWDGRFFYVEQSLWKQDGECANHALIRLAVTGADGIVAPDQVARIMGVDPVSPKLADWITNWIEAEATRPWPPVNLLPAAEAKGAA